MEAGVFADLIKAAMVAASIAVSVQPAWADAPKVALAAPASLLEVTLEKRSVVVIVYAIRDLGGRIGVCGALWPKSKAEFALSRKSAVLKNIFVEVRGKAVPVNSGVFPVYESQAQAEKEGLRCSVSGTAWAGPYAETDIEIRSRSRAIRD
jgi:hypothetical protein